MRVFLGALGWVDEEPVGNRLRWSVPVDQEVNGHFLGLPTRVIIERSIIPPGPPGDTNFFNSPTWPIPLDWWEPQGDLAIKTGTPSRIELPKTVQAVRFVYQGSETLMRLIDPDGDITSVRRITPGEVVLKEETEIAALDFLIGGGTMLQASLLDLFAGHDTDITYDQIAVLAPALSTSMSLEDAEARLSGPAGLDTNEWDEFQQDIVAQALLSTPDTPTFEDSGITRWQQFQMLMSVRWRLSLLYGFGFLDGPDAGPGTAPDQVMKNLLLQDLPTRPHIYRVRCSFTNHPEIISNPIVVQPMIASPLQIPQNFGYDHARVRLFEGADYELDAQQAMGTNDRRVIGCEIEEEIGPSTILGTATQTNSYTFRSWQPADWSGRMQMQRDTTMPFYDLPLRFRARCVDGWDRVSGWGPWTAPILPDFDHSPLPPPLMDAQFQEGNTLIYPRTPGNRFTEWAPDHAVANTPGTVLEVMRRTAEPSVVQIGLLEPTFEQSGPEELFDSFRAFFTSALLQPEQFDRGALVAPGMRATIVEINANSLVFRPISDGADTTAMLSPGSVTLQQNPSHPDLFTVVETLTINDLPGVIAFSDIMTEPEGETAIDHYAVRVDMGIVTGALSNTVTLLRHPETPPVPPPFSIEVMGVDFYDRSMVRILFLEPAPVGTYVITWAEGVHEAADFHGLAIEGDYGPQTAMNGRELFEIFSLPVSANLERMVTFGVQAKTTGGFVSDYAILPLSLPIYQT